MSKRKSELNEIDLTKIVEKYAEKWDVSEDEAAKRIVQSLAELNDEDQEFLRKVKEIPTMFPDVGGGITGKIMNINKALLSSAYTRKTLNEWRNPRSRQGVSPEVAELREKITGMENTMNEMAAVILEKQKKEELEAIFDKMKELVNPLQQRLKELETTGGPTFTSEGEGKPTSIFEMVNKMTDDAKGFLEKRGYRIDLPKPMTKEEYDKMMSDAEEKWKKDHELGVETASEEAKINAAENIITKSIDRIVGIFEVPIKTWFEGTIDERVKSTPPTGEQQQPAGLTPSIPLPSKDDWGPSLTPRFAHVSKGTIEKKEE